MFRSRTSWFVIAVVVCLLGVSVPSEARQAANSPAAEKPKALDTSQSALKTLGFGTALSMRWNVFQPDIVTEATVDANGIVRVNKRSNTTAGFVIEVHAFPKALRTPGSKFGFGPFVSAELGSDQIVSAVGLGMMAGWKIGDRGFGLGLGYASIPSAKVLGDEFKANQPAPLGPDNRPLAVRLQQRDKGSILLIASFVF